MKKEIIKQKGLNNWCQGDRTCEKCGKKVKRFHIVKGKFLCYNCSIKDLHIIGTFKEKTLEQALSKVYEIGYSINKKGYVSSKAIAPPRILIGHKIKLVLMDK